MYKINKNQRIFTADGRILGTRYDALSQKVFSILKGKKRASPDLIRQAIFIICENDFVSLPYRIPARNHLLNKFIQ